MSVTNTQTLLRLCCLSRFVQLHFYFFQREESNHLTHYRAQTSNTRLHTDKKIPPLMFGHCSAIWKIPHQNIMNTTDLRRSHGFRMAVATFWPLRGVLVLEVRGWRQQQSWNFCDFPIQSQNLQLQRAVNWVSVRNSQLLFSGSKSPKPVNFKFTTLCQNRW